MVIDVLAVVAVGAGGQRWQQQQMDVGTRKNADSVICSRFKQFILKIDPAGGINQSLAPWQGSGGGNPSGDKTLLAEPLMKNF